MVVRGSTNADDATADWREVRGSISADDVTADYREEEGRH
jgi:hypothetical protein